LGERGERSEDDQAEQSEAMCVSQFPITV
jgi:hypothetical protein